MQIKHELSATWRGHMQVCLAQIQQARQQALVLRGQIAEQEQAIAERKRHAGQLVLLIAEAESLPKSTGPYTLSDDGCFLIGEAAEEKKPEGI